MHHCCPIDYQIWVRIRRRCGPRASYLGQNVCKTGILIGDQFLHTARPHNSACGSGSSGEGGRQKGGETGGRGGETDWLRLRLQQPAGESWGRAASVVGALQVQGSYPFNPRPSPFFSRALRRRHRPSQLACPQLSINSGGIFIVFTIALLFNMITRPCLSIINKCTSAVIPQADTRLFHQAIPQPYQDQHQISVPSTSVTLPTADCLMTRQLWKKAQKRYIIQNDISIIISPR